MPGPFDVDPDVHRRAADDRRDHELREQVEHLPARIAEAIALSKTRHREADAAYNEYTRLEAESTAADEEARELLGELRSAIDRGIAKLVLAIPQEAADCVD